MQEKFRSTVFEAAVLNDWDTVADRSSLVTNTRLLLDASWQNIGGDFFMHILDHVRAGVLVISTNLFEHYDVVATTACQRHGNIRRVIAKDLSLVRSLLEFAVNDNSAVGASSCSGSDGGPPMARDRPRVSVRLSNDQKFLSFILWILWLA